MQELDEKDKPLNVVFWHDTEIVVPNSQELWLPVQDQHKRGFVNRQSWIGKGLIGQTSVLFVTDGFQRRVT